MIKAGEAPAHCMYGRFPAMQSILTFLPLLIAGEIIGYVYSIMILGAGMLGAVKRGE